MRRFADLIPQLYALDALPGGVLMDDRDNGIAAIQIILDGLTARLRARREASKEVASAPNTSISGLFLRSGRPK